MFCIYYCRNNELFQCLMCNKCINCTSCHKCGDGKLNTTKILNCIK